MSSLRNLILANTPYLWWPCNDGAGTTLFDHSGNGRHGTLSSVAWIASGPNTGLGMNQPTLDLSGASATATFTLPATADSAWTHIMWAKMLGTANGTYAMDGDRDTGLTATDGYSFRLAVSSGTPQVNPLVGSASGYLNTAAGNLGNMWSTTAFTCWAVRATTTGVLIYCNGVLVATLAYSGTPRAINSRGAAIGASTNNNQERSGAVWAGYAKFNSDIGAQAVSDIYQASVQNIDNSGLLQRVMLSLAPTHYWPMVDESLGTAVDLGSLNKPLAWTSLNGINTKGMYDYAQQTCPLLNGSSSWGVTGSTDAIPTQFAIGGWMYRTATGQLIPMVYNTTGNPFRLGYHTAGDKWVAVIGDAVGNAWMQATDPTTIVNSRWYFVCMTYDGTTLRQYTDGVETANSTGTTGTRDTTASNVYIGRYNGTFTNYWAGRLAHLFIIPNAITAAQVASIYKAGLRCGVAY